MKFFALSLLVLVTAFAARAVPTTLTYAGVLTDDGVRVEGTIDVTFALFDDDTAGTEQYSEDVPGLVIIDGELVAELGNNALDDAILDLPELWLEVTVDGTALTPRVRLNSVPYALRAEAALRAEDALTLGGLLPIDLVTQQQLATLGLQAGVLAGTGITVNAGTVSIATAGVTSVHLASNAVTTAAILDGNVTLSKLATNSVDAAKIIDGNVSLAKLASDAVDGSKIVDGSVGSSDIGPGAVGGSEIQNGSITGADIAPSTITTDRIQGNVPFFTQDIACVNGGGFTLAATCTPLSCSAGAGRATCDIGLVLCDETNPPTICANTRIGALLP